MDILLSRVEFESFSKSFLLFFISLSLLSATLFYFNYQKDIETLDEKLFTQMRLCSYDLKCTNFDIDFVPLKSQELYKLYKNQDGLESFFPISKAEKFLMLLKFDTLKYEIELNILKKQALWGFSFVITAIFFLSVLFSLYSLSPLRNALLLTQEFIRDILHDFNTPLSSLRLNASMLKKEIGENSKIDRIEISITNILNLQKHLRSYLENHSLQSEEFDLKSLIHEHINTLSKNYPNLNFEINIPSTHLTTSKEAFSRILDNVLSNAAKYNQTDGSILLTYQNHVLSITDTGKGIHNPKRIFERFYKEQDRGIGIGLHIVKKLCDELTIKIHVTSKVGEGTRFMLNLSNVLTKH